MTSLASDWIFIKLLFLAIVSFSYIFSLLCNNCNKCNNFVSVYLSDSVVCVADRLNSFRPLDVSLLTLRAKIQYHGHVPSCYSNQGVQSVIFSS